MIRVFVSYRRDDSRHQAGRLYDYLVEQFGKKYVFKDVDSIPLGSDFRAVLTERVAGCDVFLAVMGDSWLSSAGPGGTRRLDDPGDFVRIEVEAALGRSIPVIPVLVGGSSVPKPEELPKTLRELAFRNGLQVRPNPDFHDDVERLIRGIKAAVSGSPRPPARRLGLIGLVALTSVLGVLLLGIIVYMATNKGRPKTEVDDQQGAADKELVRSDPAPGGAGGQFTGPARPLVEKPSVPTAEGLGAKPQTPPAAPNRIPAVGRARLARVNGPISSWSVEGDELVKESPGVGAVIFGDEGWSDYDLTFEVLKSSGPDGLAVGFRQSEPGRYTLFIGSTDHKHSLGQTRATHRTEIRSIPGTIRPGHWYKVKISLRGSHIRIELDDQMLFNCRDDFSQRGLLAFGANSKYTLSAGRYRNIKVTAPAGTVLWEGPPDLPKE
jgi:hypothetical protein